MTIKSLIKSKNSKFIYIALSVFLVAIAIHIFRFFSNIEHRIYDFGVRHKSNIKAIENLVTVDIDDPAITTIGRWPWNWSIHQNLFEFLYTHNTRHIIATDIDLSKIPMVSVSKEEVSNLYKMPDKQGKDFISEMISERDPNRIFKTADKIGKRLFLTGFASTTGQPNLSESYKNPDLYYFLTKESLHLSLDSALEITSITPPLKLLQERSAGTGVNIFIPDDDGTVRRYPLVIRYQNKIYPSIAIKIIMDLGGYRDIEATDRDISLMSKDKTISIPHDKGQVLINWAGDYENSFVHIPFNLLSSYIVLQVLKDSLKGTNLETIPDINQLHTQLVNRAKRVGLMSTGDAENLATIIFLSFLMEYYFTHTPYSVDEVLLSLGLDANNPDFYKLARKIYLNNVIAREITKKGSIDINRLIKVNRLKIKEEEAIYITHSYKQMQFYLKRFGTLNTVRPLYFETPKELLIGKKKVAIDPTFFENKSVFYGLTATGLTSQNPTPVMQRHPMLDIVPQVVNTVITENIIMEIPTYLQIVLIALYVGISVILGSRFTPLTGLFILIVIVSLHITASWFAFQKNNLLIPVSTFVMSLLGGFGFSIFARYFEEYKERKMVRDLFSTMVSPEVLRMLQDRRDAVSLTGEVRDATIFSSDVSGFTTISEGVTAQELAKILNIYLTAMSNVIMSFDGYIDKYEGDAIKAGFGVPLQDSEHPWKACYSALLQQQELKIVKQMILMRYGVEITARMGINTGEVYAGKMGSEKRLQYTFMGEAVHIAEELEPANKLFNTWIAISGETMKRSGDFIHSRYLGDIEIGFEKVKVYELVGW
ncbi:MAG: CHASE2 domain-containing protein, partial [Thermodesulfovibrionales bacterium]